MAETLEEWSEAFEVAVPRDQRDASLAARRSDECVIKERRLFVEQLPTFPAAMAARTRPLSTNAALEGANTRWRRSNGSNIPRCTSRAASAVRAPAASSCITTALRYVNGSAG
jgi:hypothetical protein